MKRTGSRLKKGCGPDKVVAFREVLLEWYDANARDLPWRYRSGATPEPYKVWLSEIMLQQTTVTAVIPYFLKFTALWPNVFALADADIDDVMREWAGLGYYARARNLHKCAQIVAYVRGGVFPEDQRELMALPGIGEYTSAAIRAIAFGQPATVVDGNVERVMARVHGLSGDAKSVKKEAKAHARAYFEGYEARPGDLAQAFMDLGATICIPKVPRCGGCPIENLCNSAHVPMSGKSVKSSISSSTKPVRKGYVYWIKNKRGEVLLVRRPQGGLLGGMVGLPTSLWAEDYQYAYPPSYLRDEELNFLNLSFHHHFTHFILELQLAHVSLDLRYPLEDNEFWASKGTLIESGLPSVFKKAAHLFLGSRISC